MSDKEDQKRPEKRTYIEDGTELKGTLQSQHPIVVMGQLEGEISGPALYVTDTGRVSGRLKLKELHSRGELAGEIEAESAVLAGRVQGKTSLRAATLEVMLSSDHSNPGVVFEECEMEIGEVPDKAAVIAAAREPQKATPAAPFTTQSAPGATGVGMEPGPSSNPDQETAAPVEQAEDRPMQDMQAGQKDVSSDDGDKAASQEAASQEAASQEEASDDGNASAEAGGVDSGRESTGSSRSEKGNRKSRKNTAEHVL